MVKSISWEKLYIPVSDELSIRAEAMSLASGVYRISGKNGVGKSILLRHLIQKKKGDAPIVRKNCKQILYLTNEEISFPALTIAENLLLIQRIFSIRDKVSVELFTEENLSCLAKHASLGTRHKVGLSLALSAHFWDIIVVDETLSNLDTAAREQVLLALKRRAEEGSIVFIVDHQLPSQEWMKELVLEKGVLYEKR